MSSALSAPTTNMILPSEPAVAALTEQNIRSLSGASPGKQKPSSGRTINGVLILGQQVQTQTVGLKNHETNGFAVTAASHPSEVFFVSRTDASRSGAFKDAQKAFYARSYGLGERSYIDWDDLKAALRKKQRHKADGSHLAYRQTGACEPAMSDFDDVLLIMQKEFALGKTPPPSPSARGGRLGTCTVGESLKVATPQICVGP